MTSYDLIWRLIVLLLYSNKDNESQANTIKDESLKADGQPPFFFLSLKKRDLRTHISVQIL